MMCKGGYQMKYGDLNSQTFMSKCKSSVTRTVSDVIVGWPVRYLISVCKTPRFEYQNARAD